MKNSTLHKAAFSYNGTIIHDRGETLNLTDMWRAAGAPDGRAPNDWKALPQAVEFIQHIALSAGISGNKHIVTKTGRSGGTWAHWQIGMAYAKYLSPEFHEWCNGVVRAHMESSRVAHTMTTAQIHAELKLRITACNAGTRLLGEARRNGGPEYAAQIMPVVLNMLGIKAPADLFPSPLRQGNLFAALPNWPSQPPH
ncbi:KilA-N domain-containing protein (plasmid) [Azospirillum sp. HJ39]|uniref:KilA-N domain-containing protein n=1 Tax=Azospirillum sp. HJ39 TaxID=3159496 RepID=UPI003557DF3A